MSEMLEIKNLSVEYNIEKTVVHALDQVSLSIGTKGTIGVVGESGSGKTTLGMCIMNLIEPPGKISTGQVSYLGKNILDLPDKALRKYRWEEVAMIYQSAMNSLNPVKTVTHPIVEVLRHHKGMSKVEATEKAINLLKDVGINPSRANSYPHEMSGGMRQRVVIALALALSPKILIADEPTSALDVVTQKQILALIKREITQNNQSMIFITHEIALLNGLVEEIAVMYAGEVVERGKLADVIAKPFHPYTEMLLSTILAVDSPKRDLAGFATAAKERAVSKQMNACRYSNRCKYAFDRCSRERPLLKESDNGRLVACHKYN
ncbi:MAG: ABC transporter ATP-binding protein [Nitrososphaerota archaeon]|jgi:peptide/nickel transport system ATP-binding protein|nr:ABC transporter ATP-binding protein [Nitrososphaerota archaeon]